MASRQPATSYDETTLQALEQALRDVWQVLKAHDPLRDWDKDADFRRGLAEADGPGRRWGDRPTRISQPRFSQLRFDAVPLAMPKQKPVSPLARRDSRGVISELDATGLALMMRQNAEALFLDLAGRSREFNPATPQRLVAIPDSSKPGTNSMASASGRRGLNQD